MAKTFETDLKKNTQRNLIINGNMDFWQRGTSFTRANTTGYSADRFSTAVGVAGSAKSVTSARSTDIPAGLLYPAQYSMQITNNNAIASPTAADAVIGFMTTLEAQFVSHLSGGSGTLGFWMWNDVARSTSIAVRANGGTSSYVSLINVNAGWDYYTLPVTNIPTIAPSISEGLNLIIGSYSGTPTSTLNSWQAGAGFAATGATNWMATTGVKMRLAQPQFRAGIWSKEDMKTSFNLFSGEYTNELVACKRYCESSYQLDVNPGTGGTTASGIFFVAHAGTISYLGGTVPLVPKRTTPVATIYSTQDGATGVMAVDGVNKAVAPVVTTKVLRVVINNIAQLANAFGTFHYLVEADF